MTRDMLKEYHELQIAADDVKNHINDCENELKELEAESLTSDNTSGHKKYVISGNSARYQSKKTLLRQRKRHLQQLEDKIADRSHDVEDFIFRIDSIRLQRIFILRYIDNLPWFKVAMDLGSGSSEEAVRKEHDRYLKSLGL